MKKKKKIKKLIKNPSKESLFSNSDENDIIKFYSLLAEAIIDAECVYLSDALVFKSIKFQKCDDCERMYHACFCEGSKYRYGTCEECGYGYCLCQFNIKYEKDWDGFSIPIINDLTKCVIYIINKYLTFEEILNFENYINKKSSKISQN